MAPPPAPTAGSVELLPASSVAGFDIPASLHGSQPDVAGFDMPPDFSVVAKKNSWRADAMKANMGLLGALIEKAEPQDTVLLDNFMQTPHDRGPVVAGPDLAADGRLLRSWQLQATGGKLAAAAVLHDLNVERIPTGGVKGMTAKAMKEIVNHQLDDTFYVVDLANVLRMYKCYPEPGILRLLNALGTGFDCASLGEVDMMLKMGVHPSRIIFAHPCKRGSDIRYAKEHGVDYTTFDTLSELHKVAVQHPDFKLVLRIRADDPDARVPLGLKYGADVADAPLLLRTAKQLGLNVVGVSFHVGSACKNLCVFSEAIGNARAIFDMASNMGFDMELLDIGGGFTGHFDAHGNVMFGDIANTINTALSTYFPVEMGVRVIAEPGRYFAETAATLLTPIYGHRDRIAPDGEVKKDYWITDGLYGSFNCIIYDGQNPEYTVMRSPLLPEPGSQELFKSTLWGPTCDSADCVYKDHLLPELRNGDWLLFPNAGAYTVAGACDFNGIQFTAPNKYYVFSESAVDQQEETAAVADIEQSDDSADEAMSIGGCN